MARQVKNVTTWGNNCKRPLGPHVFVRSEAPKTSKVFDSFWYFAYERQEIYFRRLDGLQPPWTADPILQVYRFTNAYRATDRVSQYLIRHVIYGDPIAFSTDDIVFRVLLYKLFNKVETWELLERSLGQLTWKSYDFNKYDRVLTKAIDEGRRIYSAAYIMPACAAMSNGDARKHRSHLRLLEHLIRDGLANRLAAATRMADAFSLIRSFPMMGDFLAYQYAIDINYSDLTGFGEDEFVVPGPGAHDGLRKVFSDPGDFTGADLIRWVMDRQDNEFSRRNLPFRSLWGRQLQLIDCQNLFCEISKYARVRHPEFTGAKGRVRIKQKFEQAGAIPMPYFPPKWGLNQRIQESVRPYPHASPVSLFGSTPPSPTAAVV